MNQKSETPQQHAVVHTPGLWEYQLTESVQTGLDKLITSPVRPVGWAYSAVDARLMAAAPELLKALKWIMQAAATDSPEMWSYASAAIRKAESVE